MIKYTTKFKNSWKTVECPEKKQKMKLWYGFLV